MIRRPALAIAATALIGAGVASLASPAPARALNVVKPVCTVAGFINQLAGKACSLLGAGGGGVASTATTELTMAAVVAWVVVGAKYVLHQTSHVLGATTSPQLTSTWFSATYWRMAGIAALLTLPFLFAAAIQALITSDLSLLLRSALGYLPLALLAVAIAAPVIMLLLAASDQLSAIVSAAAGNRSARFLQGSIALLGSVSALVGAPFIVLMIALVTVAGALVLWVELLIREAAVYVIVLMLPLAFAAFVWPARRVWAIRSVELLVALILSKFAMVAVLALGGAALSQSVTHSVTGLLAGGVLLALAAFAPWALLRVIPFTEIAGSATASAREGSQAFMGRLAHADVSTSQAEDWAAKTAQMRRSASDAQSPDRGFGETRTNGASAAKENLDATAGFADSGASAETTTPSLDATDPTTSRTSTATSTSAAAPSSTSPASATSAVRNSPATVPDPATPPASAAAPGTPDPPAAEPAAMSDIRPDLGTGSWNRLPSESSFDLENPPTSPPVSPDAPGRTADMPDPTAPGQPPAQQRT